jgi:hypothetical protein
MKIGTNLAAPVYFGRGWVFSNVLQMSRNWAFVDDRESVVPVLDDGYPDFSKIESGKTIMTSMFVNADGHYPGGTYWFSYEGIGTVRFSRAVTVIVDYGNVKMLHVDPTKGSLGVFIDYSDPENHIRDMVLFPLHEYGTQFYQKSYIEHVSRFDTIRFMDWQMINHVVHVPSINKRSTPNSVRQAGHGTGRSLPAGEDGVAIELMIELCNQAQVNPWFCMYHLFNEDYVRLFARLVRDFLDPELKIRIEWSNEVWNSQFFVYNWVGNQANTLGLSRQEVIRREIDRNWAI